MRLYIEGHNHRRGYAISRQWTASEIQTALASGEVNDSREAARLAPVRYVRDPRRARRIVERFNRIYGV